MTAGSSTDDTCTSLRNGRHKGSPEFAGEGKALSVVKPSEPFHPGTAFYSLTAAGCEPNHASAAVGFLWKPLGRHFATRGGTLCCIWARTQEAKTSVGQTGNEYNIRSLILSPTQKGWRGNHILTIVFHSVWWSERSARGLRTFTSSRPHTHTTSRSQLDIRQWRSKALQVALVPMMLLRGACAMI
jgi:hypothetical protein